MAASLLALAVGAVGLVGVIWIVRGAPRSDRDWAVDHARPAAITVTGDEARIASLRDFRHRSAGASEEAYRDVTLAVADVRGVWLVLAPFANRWRGLAHSFVSFELTDDRFVAVSIEARREADESYSLVGGALRRFEITYVVGTESDVIGLRLVRGDTIFLYPSRATPEQARSMFVDMMRRAEALRLEPEYYHTLLNNCNTNLRDHVNRVVSDPLPWGWGVLLPGFADELAHRHGLLRTDLPIRAARRRFKVDPDAVHAATSAGVSFSRALRVALGAGDP